MAQEGLFREIQAFATEFMTGKRIGTEVTNPNIFPKNMKTSSIFLSY